MYTEKELRRYGEAWLSRLRYHAKNLVLLIRELDGLDGGYTSLLEGTVRSMAVGKGDQMLRQSTSATHSFRRRSRSPPDAFSVARAGTLCIDYEAQFYAELRAYHDANYAWILVHEILRCPPDATGILDALLYDLNSVGASPPPEVPAHPRPDDVEQAFDLRIFWETPRMAAVTSEFKPDSMKKLQGKIEAFRSTSPYSPPFLIGYKHGDGIPHFRPELAAFL